MARIGGVHQPSGRFGAPGHGPKNQRQHQDGRGLQAHPEKGRLPNDGARSAPHHAVGGKADRKRQRMVVQHPQQQDARHPAQAVVHVDELCSQQRRHGQPFLLFLQPPDGQQAQQQRGEDVELVERMVERIHIEGLGDDARRQQAKRVAGQAARVLCADGNAPGKQRERQAADDAQPHDVRQERGADMVENHADDRDDSQQTRVMVGIGANRYGPETDLPLHGGTPPEILNGFFTSIHHGREVCTLAI